MIDKSHPKDLFQLQSSLMDMKIETAVNKSIDRILVQIRDLQREMHSLRDEMNSRFSSLENRMVAVETKLGMVNETQRELRTRFIEYAFRAGWLVIGISIPIIFTHINLVFR